jgi:hypothetical protein
MQNRGSTLGAGTLSNATLSVQLRKRANPGTGAWSTLGSDLSIIAVGGRDAGVRWDDIVDTVVQHVLDTTTASDWSPKSETRENALRAALEHRRGEFIGGTSHILYLTFDGQFGEVSAT